MASHLYNVLATIEREQAAHGWGIPISEKVLTIRRNNRRMSNPDDEMWIAAAEGNLAVSLMASGRVGEALEILSRLRQRADMEANRDVYLRNTCLCLLILGRNEEALSTCREAFDAARQKRGDSSEQVAT
jgi:tetratricopeptide (TPR) repeat protein